MFLPIVIIGYIFPMIAIILALPIVTSIVSKDGPRNPSRGDYLISVIVGIMPIVNWIIAALVFMAIVFLAVRATEIYFPSLQKPMFWE